MGDQLSVLGKPACVSQPGRPQAGFRRCSILPRQRPYTLQNHENLGKNGIDSCRRRGTLTYTAEQGREFQHVCPRPDRIADFEVFLHIARRIDAYTAYIPTEARKPMPTLFATRLGSVIPVTLAILLVTAAGHAQISCGGYEVTAMIVGPWCGTQLAPILPYGIDIRIFGIFGGYSGYSGIFGGIFGTVTYLHPR